MQQTIYHLNLLRAKEYDLDVGLIYFPCKCYSIFFMFELDEILLLYCKDYFFSLLTVFSIIPNDFPYLLRLDLFPFLYKVSIILFLK